jgi:hypothetical protein
VVRAWRHFFNFVVIASEPDRIGPFFRYLFHKSGGHTPIAVVLGSTVSDHSSQLSKVNA